MTSRQSGAGDIFPSKSISVPVSLRREVWLFSLSLSACHLLDNLKSKKLLQVGRKPWPVQARAHDTAQGHDDRHSEVTPRQRETAHPRH